MFQSTEQFDQDLAAAAVEHVTSGSFSGPLYGAKVGLIAAPITISRTTILSAVTVPTYSGYAENAETWTGPTRDPDGDITLVGSQANFTMPDGTSPQTIYGWYLLDSTGAKFYGGEIWASPLPLTDALSLIGVIPKMDLSDIQDSTSTVVS